jgi:hypothetical protein
MVALYIYIYICNIKLADFTPCILLFLNHYHSEVVELIIPACSTGGWSLTLCNHMCVYVYVYVLTYGADIEKRETRLAGMPSKKSNA